ncbi:MAG: sugar phosphate nucleotidyltransferase, partial [Bacteroidales bacterium]|nr:sugar phosphate nucleotidyltransferase [Bacteroidales bacterium]
GVEPTRPETGYGYIYAEEKKHGEVVKVKEFKEKPTLATAKKYIAAGRYFWNAGIFVWNVKTIVENIRKFAPQIADVMDKIAKSFGTWKETETTRILFPTCPKISIDYAVMEKSKDIFVIASDLGWSDLGAYSAIKQYMPIPEDDPVPDCGSVEAIKLDNKVVGKDVRLHGCKGCIVHTEDARTVVVSGLKDYVVAMKGADLLICPIAEEQKVKEYSAKKNNG